MFVWGVEKEWVRLLGRHAGQEIADLRIEIKRRKLAVSDVRGRAFDIRRLRDAAASHQNLPAEVNNLGIRKVVGRLDVGGQRLPHMLYFGAHAPSSDFLS